MLSVTAEYAIRAVLYVARQQAVSPVKLEDVAEALDAPRNYLSKTLHQLAQAGVLVSQRGPKGGFVLAVPPEKLTLAAIVAPFDSTALARRCLLGEGPCSDETPCAAHERWKHISVPMRAFFRETTVGELLDETRELELRGVASRPLKSPVPPDEATPWSVTDS